MNNWDSRIKKQESYRNGILGNSRNWHGLKSLGFSDQVLDALNKILPNLSKELKQRSYKSPRYNRYETDYNVDNVVDALTKLVKEISLNKQDLFKSTREINNILGFKMPAWIINSTDDKNIGFCINDSYLKDSDGFDHILSLRQNIDYWTKYLSNESNFSHIESIANEQPRFNFFPIDTLEVTEHNQIKRNKKIFWILGSLFIASLIGIIISLILVFC